MESRVESRWFVLWGFVRARVPCRTGLHQKEPPSSGVCTRLNMLCFREINAYMNMQRENTFKIGVSAPGKVADIYNSLITNTHQGVETGGLLLQE